MFKKMKVDRNFVEWLAEILPEYQHEDVSPLGDNIHQCLSGHAQRFTVMYKPTPNLKQMKMDLTKPKMLVKAYFHNLVLIKIVPEGSGSVDRSA